MERCNCKVEFLSSSPAERGQNIVRLKVGDYWIEPLRAFYAEHGCREYRAIFEDWSLVSEGAFNLFHEVRDRVCVKMGDSSQQHKEHIKKYLKKTFGITLENGKLKSTTLYTTAEMCRLIDGAFQLAYSVEADVRDLEEDKREWHGKAEKQKDPG